ncbi:MAG: YbaN family protein [Sphaerochaeta sp.]|nr:YbaN family protein [Sphaerochaeta sp.]
MIKKDFKHYLLIAAGSLCVIVGGIGILLPILPTTPFVLLAATCFSLSSPRLEKKLEQNKTFGPYLTHWRTHEGVPFAVKRRVLIFLYLSLGVSAFIVKNSYVMAILSLVGIGVTIHILLIKTKPEETPFTSEQEA